ncbi:MarR family winged helix-turn-helix transcriptional regulator [Nonomuraea insulae]|uniref:MarR family winged helix-turn-helix transcriptional regulator n=1 Tax=Nonomuraea insulae TaxID=1616787 RepID=A0ABW1D324_9ACTN
MHDDRPLRRDLYNDLENELIALARRARRRNRDQARSLHPRLDATALPVILVLARSAPLRMTELAEALLLDKSTASRQVDAVARLGLVERVPDPADARARLARLTPEGQKRAAEVLAEQRHLLTAALNDWSEADLKELTRLLGQLRDSGVT